METTLGGNISKKFIFKDEQKQTIEVIMEINDEDKLVINTELNENNSNKKIFKGIYTLEEIKEKNNYFLSIQRIDEILNELIILLKDEKNANYKRDKKKIYLMIPTNVSSAPQVILELKEEGDINTKIEEMNEHMIKFEKEILKENRELKQKISYLEYLLNLNFGITPEYYFDRIREWIGGDKDKIQFTLIFKLFEKEERAVRYNNAVNLSCPEIFIFITENLSIFGSYCPNYKTSGGWIADSNAFLFSLNLDKKYPAKIAQKNYFCNDDYYGKYDFTDIKFSYFLDRKGVFDKTGTYLDNYELEGNCRFFRVKHFMVYKVEYINNNNDYYTAK